MTLRWSDSELEQARVECAIANRILSEIGLATGVRASLGHASIRLPSHPELFVVKGRGYYIDVMSRMRPEDMVVCDMEGNWVDGPPESMQPGEVKMHSCILRARPDVNSVVHVHPKFTVIMSTLQQALVPMVQEGAALVRNPLPVYPRSKVVVTEEEGQEVTRLLGSEKMILLKGHGAATTGVDLQDSCMAMIQLEHQAEMNYYAYLAEGEHHRRIPDENVEQMVHHRSFTQPHFVARTDLIGLPKTTGIWQYYSELVSADM
jgi:ribulose-5-phosphate 4-epimerase/fuculose-1-phosphate aldolase